MKNVIRMLFVILIIFVAGCGNERAGQELKDEPAQALPQTSTLPDRPTFKEFTLWLDGSKTMIQEVEVVKTEVTKEGKGLSVTYRVLTPQVMLNCSHASFLIKEGSGQERKIEAWMQPAHIENVIEWTAGIFSGRSYVVEDNDIVQALLKTVHVGDTLKLVTAFYCKK